MICDWLCSGLSSRGDIHLKKCSGLRKAGAPDLCFSLVKSILFQSSTGAPLKLRFLGNFRDSSRENVTNWKIYFHLFHLFRALGVLGIKLDHSTWMISFGWQNWENHVSTWSSWTSELNGRGAGGREREREREGMLINTRQWISINTGLFCFVFCFL